ncbi:hypothetical protein KV112_20570 [Mycolicibacter sp. MYC123]|uniref:HTH merR-type domain-containing protein n=1 Tax=[Mycobacterium] zoologicum TaxID=2872311 RepID=A0ABU5YT29_9MYCO|nr:hypothetical protein [Mycolicibacter sp. MYC123]MEB3052109.1 hypothetical protein [Mycolicibacter sp. MYC123]
MAARQRTRAERRRYTARRAQRTAGAARHRQRWLIEDARMALDLSLTVPQAAERLGRTAAAVEALRAKWRRGELGEGLAFQVPAPPPTAGREETV